MLAVPSHSPLTLGPRNLPRVFPSTSASTPDTFILPRRQVLWPQLATQSGTWAWAGGADRVFGGYLYNTTPGAGTLTFPNVNLFSGSVKLNIIHRANTDGAVASVYWGSTDPGDKLGEIYMNSTINQNNVQQIDLGTVTAGLGNLIIVVESGIFRSQQLELIQPTGTNLGTSIDDLPWFGDIPPICYSAASAAPSLAQDAVYHWGSHLFPDASVGGWIEYQAWLPQGSVDLTITCYTGAVTDSACAVSLNGVSQGTVNLNISEGGPANQQRSLSLSVPYTGVHTVRLTRGTNGAFINWISWRKTAETGAITPTGTTYGVGSMELWPWFADAGNFNGLQLGSDYLHYALSFASGYATPGTFMDFAHGLQPGTYQGKSISREANSRPIMHVSENGGADLTTFDCYNAANVNNAIKTFSLPLVGGDLTFSADSKNPLSSNYLYMPTVIRLVRTGD